ncbi:hypothetical protein M422DRAFT_269085 [Sphaerobolus stellatus SS14]|uniref:Cytochrome P450 n=1 Tax=Sphaerobolus stellatus (strain SS14) TaxID=990650 RepID=A0A0C9UWM0_SPHS4|nr:hypothetical protein M422DRAFT_269085 [Sphaerobolus stellatus SS14]
MNDPYIRITEEAMKALGEAGIPGTFFVDMLPWMKYIPEWVPGASFKRKARVWRKALTDMSEVPYQHVKLTMANGTAIPSFTSSHLEALASKMDVPPDAEQVIKNTAGVRFAAGADTMVNTLNTFILAMALFPDTQKKAQAKLHSVVGRAQLPDFKDKDILPPLLLYIKRP